MSDGPVMRDAHIARLICQRVGAVVHWRPRGRLDRDDNAPNCEIREPGNPDLVYQVKKPWQK